MQSASIARYSQAVLARTKTDATDARRIARFCEAHEVAPWTPAPPLYRQLRALVTARETLVQATLRCATGSLLPATPPRRHW